MHLNILWVYTVIFVISSASRTLCSLTVNLKKKKTILVWILWPNYFRLSDYNFSSRVYTALFFLGNCKMFMKYKQLGSETEFNNGEATSCECLENNQGIPELLLLLVEQSFHYTVHLSSVCPRVLQEKIEQFCSV